LFIAFVALAFGLFPASRAKALGAVGLAAVGAAYLVSAVFPCDRGCPSTGSLSQTVHNAFGLLEYIGAIAGFAFLGAAFRHASRPIPWVCAICAAIVALGFVAVLVPALAPYRGLSQRIAEASIFTWLVCASCFVIRQPPRAA
jgi:NhaP-type Na+/H+ or K+/H+ antiporter